MPVPTITPLPTPPVRSDAPADFSAKADTFVAALPGFGGEANALAAFVDQRATDADASAQAAADSEQAAELARVEVAANTQAVADNTQTVIARADQVALDAGQVAGDRQQVAADAQAVADALVSIADGPVASVAGKSGVVTVEDLSAGGVATQNGAETLNNKTINSTRYTVASVATTETLDLATSQVFRVDASSPRTLTFSNAPGANRAMVVVIHITGQSAVIWPSSIAWDSGSAPILGAAFTRVVLFWDGVQWTGTKEVSR